MSHRLVLSHHLHGLVHGDHPFGRLNARLAVWITNVVGTMLCAYVFAGLALVALPAAVQSGSPTVLVNWLSSNFAQLVLLPIIIVGQRIASAASDQRALTDHEILARLDTMQADQLEILRRLDGVRTPKG